VPRTCSFESDSARETKDAGMKLGRLLSPGDFICLKGELGAGKTTFVQGVVSGMDSEDIATSPSFALVNEYHGRITLYHIDLYRLGGPADLESMGFAEFPGEGAAMVEWPERAGDELPDERLEFFFEHTGEDRRMLTLTAFGARYEELLESICPRHR
jgi:tRNA threonylcarbamoyladenosine biosynthesis protein TsaE